MNRSTEKELRQLRFSGDTERAFREEYSRRSLGHIRFVFLLALFLIAVYGLAELPLDPDTRLRRWLLRYAVVCPSLLAVTLFSFTPVFARFAQAAIGLAVLVVGLSVLGVHVNTPGAEHFLYVHFIFLIMCAYTLVKLRVLYATAVGWTLMAAYAITALTLSPALLTGLPRALTYLLIANLFGMLAGSSMEHYIRRDFLLTRLIEAEQRKSEQLLLSILPGPIVERLKEEQGTIADSFPEVTVLFADIVDFTPLCARLSPTRLVDLLTAVFSAMDHLAEKHGVEKIKTMGDAYMAVAGLPVPREDHTEAIAEFALDLQAEISRFTGESGQPLALRIGINTGPVVAGVIGTKKFIYDLWGDAVNLASRMESHGIAGSIQVTEATYARLRDKYRFEERGAILIKGKTRMPVYLLVDRFVGLPQLGTREPTTV
jgi:class 3 adenylate cyclase